MIRRISRIRLAGAAVTAAVLAGVAGPLTAHAGDVITGTGFMNGSLWFDSPVQALVAYAPGNTPPVHVAVGACNPSHWYYNDLVGGLSDGGAVADESALVWYQGFVGISGLQGGASFGECPGFVVGGGWSLSSVTGQFPTHQSVNCGNIGGQYDRVGTVVVALGTYGGCSVQQYAPGNVTFKVLGNLAPNTIGGGVAAPVSSAYFSGVWEVSFPA